MMILLPNPDALIAPVGIVIAAQLFSVHTYSGKDVSVFAVASTRYGPPDGATLLVQLPKLIEFKSQA